MEELKKKIEQALVDAGNGLKLERIDEEQKILYMEQNGNFEPCVDTALKIINRFPEFAAVVFNFNGYSRTVVTRQTTKQDIGRLFLPCSQLFAENAIAHAYLNRSRYEGYNEILTHVLWNSPEGIEAGRKLEDAVAEADVILEQVKAIEISMQPAKQEYEGYLAKIKQIRKIAESAMRSARSEYDGAIYNHYEAAIEAKEQKEIEETGEVKKDFEHPVHRNFASSERYLLARLSGESSFADIRENPDGYSRVSPMLKEVFQSPEGIAAGEKLDRAVAEANETFEQVNDLEKEMQPSKKKYESHLAKIELLKKKAGSIISTAESKYQKTIRKIFDGVVEQRKDQILAEAQRILELEEAQRGQGNGTPSDSGQSSESEPGTN